MSAPSNSCAEGLPISDEENNKSVKKSDPLSLLQTRSGRCIKYNSDYLEKNLRKRERQNLINQVKKAMSKNLTERTKDDLNLLENCQDLVEHVDLAARNRENALKHQEIVVDTPELLEAKCKQLAESIFSSKNCVVYTGAGISTSASIPDYRGPNGLWTMLERGMKVEMPDFAIVDPTYSHMALSSMMKLDLVKYVVSQNCDGLHLRSGIDPNKLSELHGNCFIEFCPECYRDYIRDFDVTEKTSFRKHSTGRYCKYCKIETNIDKNNEIHDIEKTNRVQLRDSIIHFGEKLRNGQPYNWELAKEAIKKADLIICLGTSLKVLKHYACLWPKKKSVQLYIVNIQWTPKDKQAKLKINGYCDEVLNLIVKNLQEIHKVNQLKVDDYIIKNDPLFKIAVQLTKEEIITTSKVFLTTRLKNNENSNLKHLKSMPNLKNENECEDSDQVKNSNNSNSWYNKSFKPRTLKKATSTIDLKAERKNSSNQ